MFDFLTYSREAWFSFSYAEFRALDQANEAFNEIDRVSKFDDFSFTWRQAKCSKTNIFGVMIFLHKIQI